MTEDKRGGSQSDAKRTSLELEREIKSLRRENELLKEQTERLSPGLKGTELQRINALLESILNNTHIMVAYMDLDFNFIRVNAAYAYADEREPSDFPGKNHFDLFPNKENEATFKKVVETGAPYFAEAQPFENELNPERGVSYRDWSLVPIEDAEGTLSGLMLTQVNVTDHKVSETALKKIAETTHALFEATNDSVYVIGRNERLISCNRLGAERIGRTLEEMPGIQIFDLLPPDLAESRLKKVRTVFETGESLRFEDGRDGTYFENSVYPMHDHRDQVYAVAVYARDITEQKQARKKLRETEERFYQFADAIDHVLWVGDRKTQRVLFINRAFERLYGRSVQDVVADPEIWLKAVHPEDKEWVREQIRNELGKEDTNGLKIEFRIVHPNGEVRWVSDYTVPIKDEGGKRTGFAGLLEDITERKQLEEENLALERQVQHSQKLESLGLLAGGIAHDFNNLLMVILGNADLALSDLPTVSPTRESVVQIEKAAQRAADLTRQLLAYSGRGRFVVEFLCINTAIEEISHIMEVSISKKASLILHLEENMPLIETDATQVRQVVMNLITNASEAIGDTEGTISLRTGVMECDRHYFESAQISEELTEGNYVYIEVSDTGCGMDKETTRKMFDPFFSTKFTGRGLGLAAVLGIMRNHKGAIKVYSEPEKGTLIKVLFPAAGRAAEPLKTSVEPVKTEELKGTVLLVDDEESIRSVTSKMLERVGFTILLAEDGKQAIETFEDKCNEIDCVLLDLTMPVMDGEECYHELRQIKADVSVILSSGYNQQDVSQRFTGNGPASFIQKPYKMPDLIKAVKEVLKGQGKP